MNKFLISLILAAIFCVGTGWSYIPHKLELNKKTSYRKGAITNTPADFWKLYWTGVGNLSDWVVSNTLQCGLFGRDSLDSIGKYDGSDAQQIRMQRYYNITETRGKTAEYPVGSKQYYTYECGIWIGALYPMIDSITKDTIWTPNLSRGAYQSDMGAMNIPELQNAGEAGDVGINGLTFSTQRIRAGLLHPGSFLFKQRNMPREPYQTLWCFADTTLNSRRPVAVQLNPAKGDIVSDEDTYAVSGDWIPAENATVIWVSDAGPYGGLGLGVRVEQRTYSFNMSENKNYIYTNYKIKNMNSFPLKNVYFGYFMDNDIGQGSDDSLEGCMDDMVGYDKTLNLGYTYDFDSYEPGWTTPAGYIGCVLCETPGDIGFTGFNSWLYVGPDSLVDMNLQDSLKYEKLKSTAFFTSTTPNEVRQLSSSGPYLSLQPGEEVNFTIAVVCADNLTDLKENAQNAITQFNNGYLPQCPLVNGIKAIPPVANPGDSVVITTHSYDKDGIQTISADIESPDESLCGNIQLYDDGLHHDSLAGDHIYGNIWKTPSQGNNYFVDVFSKDNTNDTTVVNNGTTFTTLGPLVITEWTIQGTDTIPSPGDSVNIQITVKNKGMSLINGVSGELTSPLYVKICDSLHLLNNIDSGAVVIQNYKIKVTENAPDTTISLILKLSDSIVGKWEDTIALKITDDKAPFLHYPSTLPRLLSAGSTVNIRAKLIDGSGIDSVIAIIENPIGTPITSVELYDDGSHLDSLAGDGFYANSWITPTVQEKFYNINLYAKDKMGNKKQYTNLMEFTTKPLTKTANILLLDDDNYNRPPLGNIKPYQQYYSEALDANGYNYDIWDVFCYGTPDTATLNQYAIVIWLTGTTSDSILWEPEYYNHSSTNPDTEQQNIKTYLNVHKGRLFFSGQAVYRVGNFGILGVSKAFTRINADTVIGIAGNPITSGLMFTIEGGTGANNQFIQSAVKKYSAYSDSIFKYKDYTGEGYAGIAFHGPWLAVTLPFGFEAIALAQTRNTLMHNIIEWLLNPAVEDAGLAIPKKYELFSSVPNPFKCATEIRYNLPKASIVDLSIYNLVGQKLITLVNEYQTPGCKKIKLDNKNLSSGIYFYKLKAGEFTAVKKIVLTK
ncbi:MAG: T9SS type A sorting domain-containing protein [bacterium]